MSLKWGGENIPQNPSSMKDVPPEVDNYSNAFSFALGFLAAYTPELLTKIGMDPGPIGYFGLTLGVAMLGVAIGSKLDLKANADIFFSGAFTAIIGNGSGTAIRKLAPEDMQLPLSLLAFPVAAVASLGLVYLPRLLFGSKK